MQFILNMAGRPRNSLLIVDAFLQPHEILAIMPDLITLGDTAFLGLDHNLSLFLFFSLPSSEKCRTYLILLYENRESTIGIMKVITIWKASIK